MNHKDLRDRMVYLNPKVIGLMIFFFLLGASSGCEKGPEPPEPPSWSRCKVLADGQDHPAGIVVDDSFAYFLTGGTLASEQAGTEGIKKVSLEGGEVTTLATGDYLPKEELAMDEDFIYWTNWGGTVMRVPKGGGEVEVVASDALAPYELAVDDKNVYWLSFVDRDIPLPAQFAPKGGGAVKNLSDKQEGAGDILVDDSFVYWMTPDGIMRAAKDGGGVVKIYAPPGDEVSVGLVQDRDNLYFTQLPESGSDWGLMKLPKKGGTPVQLTPSAYSVMDIAADDTYVYYFDDMGRGLFSPIAFRRVAKGGGEPETLDQGKGGWMKHIAVGKTHVYFTDFTGVCAIPK